MLVLRENSRERERERERERDGQRLTSPPELSLGLKFDDYRWANLTLELRDG
jgi:hypothetical protein